MRRRTSIFAFMLVVAGICQAEELPRYQLTVGQRLEYETSDVFTMEKDRAFNTHQAVTLWVTHANADGSWRLIVRSVQTFKDTGHEANNVARASYSWFDLFPDGRSTYPPRLVYRFDPALLLPQLPASADEAKTTWSYHNDITDTDTTCKPLATEDEHTFKFEAVPVRMYDKLYGMRWRWVAQFDRARGVLARMETESSQVYAFHGTGKGNVLLKSIEMMSPASIATFDKESTAAFAIEKPQSADDGDARAIDAAYAKEEVAVREALKSTTTPEVSELLNQRLKDNVDYRKDELEKAKTIAEIKAAPPADWSAKDLDGKPYALKDFRGKVVLLDYWYRGCAWCMRAMPKFNGLAEKYRNKDVVFLGMNTDRELSDAKYIVTEMKLNYPVLQAKELVDTYKIDSFGYPTLLIIDQTGRVRALHIGYSTAMTDELSNIIDGLLKDSHQ